MRLHRFYLAESGAKQISITNEELVHQWKRVFRMEAEDQVILFNGDGMERKYKFVILAKDKAEIELVSDEKNKVSFLKNITVFFSLIKKDNVEWIVEKGTELGVARFTPMVSERSEKKDVHMERLQKIAKEASEQSGRPSIPEITEVTSLADALSKVTGQVVAFHQGGESVSKFDFEKDVSLFIGPEGGWSDAEMDLFHKCGVELVSLGTQTLRAETAVLAATATILSR